MRGAPQTPRPRLRVLFLARLFGGLKQGLAGGKWEPAGVPAIYRLLEGLAADPDVDLLSVFSLKEPDPRFSGVVRATVAPIGKSVILPYRGGFGSRLRPLNTAATEIAQTARIMVLAAGFRPDIVYATYANLHAAGLLARAGHSGVVLRLMGVVPHHRRIAGGAMPVLGWQLRAPFAHVICSEDGSDPAALLPKLLRRETPWSVRLNGCDALPVSKRGRGAFRAEIGLSKRPAVVFLGRLEPQKGCLAFVDAASAVLADAPGCADFVIVGDGPLRAEMAARIRARGHSACIRLAGAQPHERATRYVAAADIYVSTNMYGNLSNANLEAIATGACIALPTSDPDIPIDTVTERLIPADAGRRYDRNRIPEALAEALGELIRAPAEVAARRARTAALAKKLIRPWAKSVETDIEHLKSIAAAKESRPVHAPIN